MTRAAAVRWAGGMLVPVLAAALQFMPALAADEQPLAVTDLTGAGLIAADAGAAQTAGVDVIVVRSSDGLEVLGRFTTHASREVVWNVLTDYDGIDRFVSSMRKSEVTRRGDGGIRVDQQAVGRLFLFSRRLRASLQVHEEPQFRIRFEDVLGRDFRFYRGEWRIEESERGIAVVYRLQAEPAFSIPDFLARGVFRNSVRELLAQVRTEIERRAALAVR